MKENNFYIKKNQVPSIRYNDVKELSTFLKAIQLSLSVVYYPKREMCERLIRWCKISELNRTNSVIEG